MVVKLAILCFSSLGVQFHIAKLLKTFVAIGCPPRLVLGVQAASGDQSLERGRDLELLSVFALLVLLD